MAGTISTWIEGIVLTLTFVLIIVILVVELDNTYNMNYAPGIGGIVDNSTIESFKAFRTTSQNQMNSSNVVSNLIGINIVSSYDIFKGAIGIIWNFLSGGFIDNIINYLTLGASGVALATAFKIIWFLTIVWAGLYVFFKVIL